MNFIHDRERGFLQLAPYSGMNQTRNHTKIIDLRKRMSRAMEKKWDRLNPFSLNGVGINDEDRFKVVKEKERLWGLVPYL